ADAVAPGQPDARLVRRVDGDREIGPDALEPERADAAREVHQPVLADADAGELVAGIFQIPERGLAAAEIVVADDAHVRAHVERGVRLLDHAAPAVEGAVHDAARMDGRAHRRAVLPERGAALDDVPLEAGRGARRARVPRELDRGRLRTGVEVV